MDQAAQIRVLVVDDDPAMQRFLEVLLTHRGWQTVAASSGSEAMERVAAAGAGEGFDVALLDAMLPDVRGYDLARRLVGDDRTAALPLCFLTGALTTRVRATAGIACILKPAMPQQVLKTIEEVIEAPVAEPAARLEAISAVERFSLL